MDLLFENPLTLSGGKMTIESSSVKDLKKLGKMEVAFNEIDPPIL
tara:strand:- start:9 stop:143 length:135 start_codon:yes stop_codon:yes gene_type:complete